MCISWSGRSGWHHCRGPRLAGALLQQITLEGREQLWQYSKVGADSLEAASMIMSNMMYLYRREVLAVMDHKPLCDL